MPKFQDARVKAVLHFKTKQIVFAKDENKTKTNKTHKTKW